MPSQLPPDVGRGHACLRGRVWYLICQAMFALWGFVLEFYESSGGFRTNYP